MQMQEAIGLVRKELSGGFWALNPKFVWIALIRGVIDTRNFQTTLADKKDFLEMFNMGGEL